jgi:hypothetical protein
MFGPVSWKFLRGEQGISTRVESFQSAAVEGGDQPVRSPLSQAPAPTSSVAGSPKAAVAKKQSQAVLTMIKQVGMYSKTLGFGMHPKP